MASQSGIRAGQAYVELYSTDSKLVRGLNQARGKLQAWGRSLRSVTGMLGVSLGVGALVAFLSKSVAAAEVQRKAEMKLAAVIGATGQAAGHTTDELKKYAAELQRVTNFGDEATLSAMALLTTFDRIKGDQFKDATRLAQDLAALKDMDLGAAAQVIGRALQDPTRGMSQLRRYGMTFSAEQEAQIKAAAGAGDFAGAQRIMLARLEETFGGVARALADPMTQLGNAFGDLKEKIGSDLLPYVMMLSEGLLGTVEDLEGGVKKAGGGWIDTLADIGQNAWLGAKASALVATGGAAAPLVGTPKELYQEFLAKTPSERAQMKRDELERRRKEWEERLAKASASAAPTPTAATLQSPRAMMAGSREAAEAEARHHNEQIEVLEAIDNKLADIRDTLQEADGASEPDVEIAGGPSNMFGGHFSGFGDL